MCLALSSCLLPSCSLGWLLTMLLHHKPFEIAPGRSLNINAKLDEQQQQKLIQVLSKYQQAFAWEYFDMKGIDPQLCTHHIYVEKYSLPIR
jgi:hypothetical protein